MPRQAVIAALTAWVWLGLTLVAAAQSILAVDQEQLLTDSLYGQALLADETERREALIREGRILDAQFEAEERQLTELRPTTDPDEFRDMADLFDAKVITTRREQEQKALALTQQNDENRRAFFDRVVPILTDIMNETGASAIVDQRALLVSKQDLNITAEVIKRLDDLYRTAPPARDPGEAEEKDDKKEGQ